MVELPVMAAKKARASDEAVNWYCHFRITEVLSSEVSQRMIAEETGITPTAINVLLKQHQGVGPETSARFAGFLGFRTRGELIDAADAWWASNGRDYAINQMMQRSHAERKKLQKKPRRKPVQAPQVPASSGSPESEGKTSRKRKTG